MHLYASLWLQKPELFAGRHLFSSWAFVSLALAHGAYRWQIRPDAQGRKRFLLTLLALWIALNSALIGDDQRAWHDHVKRVASVEAQMKDLIPEVTAETAIFAHRFVLLPSFTPYAAAVWYAEAGITGGSLDKMRGAGWLTDQTYLLDYDGDHLQNLLPDLQDYAETKILWQEPRASLLGPASRSEPPASYTLLQPAGPDHARRMAIRVRPPSDGWLALAYDLENSTGLQLVTDVLGAPGSVFRIRLIMDDGAEVLFETATGTTETTMDWQLLLVPLSAGDRSARAVVLDTRGPNDEVYWTVPRLVKP